MSKDEMQKDLREEKNKNVRCDVETKLKFMVISKFQ